MRLDPDTGTLTLLSGLEISPALTRTAFLASPEGRAARATVRGVHSNYNLLSVPDAMRVVLFFRDEALAMLQLGVHDPDGPKRWDEVTAATEQAQAAADLAWFAEQGVQLRRVHPEIQRADFAWGSVWAGRDMKDGTQGAGLHYSL